MVIRSEIYNTFHPTNKASNKLVFKGTPGVGDFMYPLNIAYFKSFVMQREIELEMHWFHSEDFEFYFEDPETIIEKFGYIHNFYEKTNTEVKVTHIFNSDRSDLYMDRFHGFERMIMPTPIPFRYNDWIFRKDIMESHTYQDKIVIFRPSFNAQPPRNFKQPLTHEQWEDIIDIIKNVHGYRVIEVDYRTPVREVLYHIKTCRATVSYEGMWHYVAKNCRKPMIVLSDDPITKTHTPDALIYNPRSRKGFDPAKGHKPKFKTNYFFKFEKRLRMATDYSKERMKYFEDLMNENR